jgi:tetratricopeptide (TPR) repeat protein
MKQFKLMAFAAFFLFITVAAQGLFAKNQEDDLAPYWRDFPGIGDLPPPCRFSPVAAPDAKKEQCLAALSNPQKKVDADGALHAVQYLIALDPASPAAVSAARGLLEEKIAKLMKREETPLRAYLIRPWLMQMLALDPQSEKLWSRMKETLKSLNPRLDDERRKELLAHFNDAFNRRNETQMALAVAALWQAEKTAPQDIDTKLYLADALQDAGNLDLAAQTLARLAAKTPHVPGLKDRLEKLLDLKTTARMIVANALQYGFCREKHGGLMRLIDAGQIFPALVCLERTDEAERGRLDYFLMARAYSRLGLYHPAYEYLLEVWKRQKQFSEKYFDIFVYKSQIEDFRSVEVVAAKFHTLPQWIRAANGLEENQAVAEYTLLLIPILKRNGAWRFPVAGYITSAIGYRLHPIAGEWRFHEGLDIEGKTGTQAVAPAAGKVAKVGYASAGAGHFLHLDLGEGREVQFLHGNKVLVNEEGKAVEPGEPVFELGSSGYSTSSHLHFEYRLNDEPQDPLKFF